MVRTLSVLLGGLWSSCPFSTCFRRFPSNRYIPETEGKTDKNMETNGNGQSVETNETNPKGFPRPVAKRNGHNSPIPWVGGDYPENGEWARVDNERALEAEMSGECIVCGLKLTDDFIYMLVSGMLASNEAGIHTPAPTFVHRKCGRIAAIFCPHLKRQEHPAVTQDGQMLTHAQLAELAKESG